ncbi:MAG TPA: hypothetical protein VK856_13245 [Anaerolineaceae bacterium]|nr:hypothetical protein [Anaerolineaceae bacterium]
MKSNYLAVSGIQLNNQVNKQYTDFLFIRNQSFALFNRTLKKGQIRRLLCFFSGKSTELIQLSKVTQPEQIESACDHGIQTVSLSMIIGSENRCRDFDNHFAPLSEHGQQRWIRISSLFLLDETIPPVELIRVGVFYFVRDGHHRISVARALGKKFIDAQVTVVHLKSDRLDNLKTKLNQLVENSV